ncbi:MAG: alpha/beta fold hydrolase [Acidimicrobiia bacterium]|nr:alpha/beta fold hydrolase [Acidimicrobiia bacterium]
MKLHVHRWGDGGRRILLLHGISSAGSGWWRVGADLAERGWTVVAPDLRGHGESPMADSYGFGDHAGDVLGLDDGWDAVLGHSMGGAIAVVAADRDPGWTRRLVLQDPALVVGVDLDEQLEWLLADFDGPMTAAWVREQLPGYHPEDARLKALALRQTTPEIVERTTRDLQPWNVLEEASRLPIDTVVLASDPGHGGIVPITIGEWLASENPNVRFRVLAGAGHSVHRETTNYDRYFEALLQALDDKEDR